MDAYEATKIVYQKIQSLDPQNASKIMGLLLIQDHGEKEMIRLAFGPESLLQSVIHKSRKELNLPSPNMPSTPNSSSPSSPSTFNSNNQSPLSLSRQNSSSRLLLPSPLSITISNNNNNNNHFSPSTTMNTSATPFYGSSEVDLIDELQLQDQLSFLNDHGPTNKSSDFFNYQDLLAASSPRNDAALYPFQHRRSCSVSDACMGSDDVSFGFGWKPCLFYARGYCKNGTTCRFVHGGDAAADGGAPGSKFQMMEQCQEQLLASNSFQNKCLNNFVLQQQVPSDSPRALLMNRARVERGEFVNNPGSRQIYLTFPADSTFKEEDVSNYFSTFGPVQDVRIPYQQKRMFGFVTFDYPDTVRLILAKGNPHFVCDARVLVKPYKEKGKIPDKLRKQQCISPTGLDSRDPFDIHLGARMLYNTQEMLWRRKLEEQADLQLAIELQNRRIMNLQILDVNKRNISHHRALSTGAVISSSPRFLNQNMVISQEANEENPATFSADHEVGRAMNVIKKDDDCFAKDENSNGNEIPLQESFEHNLPDSPFASPKADCTNNAFEAERATPINDNLITGSSLFPAKPSLDMPPFNSCYFQLPRFASGHETIGM